MSSFYIVWSSGSELLASELRLRTCVEMVTSRDSYLAHPSSDMIHQLSPSYDLALRYCSRESGYTCMWVLFALSSVLRRKIVSIYPVINNDDMAAKLVNVTLSPLTDLLVDVPLYIMWTRHGTVEPTHWTPNHFVPLFPQPGKDYTLFVYY